MASLSSDSGGGRRIQFVGPDGKRKTIRLGKVPVKLAESVKTKVEAILAATFAGLALDADTARWLGTVGDELHDKLAAVGLVPPRRRTTLGAYLDDFIAARAALKPNTRRNIDTARRKILEFFDAARELGTITAAEAASWRDGMVAQHAKATWGRIVRQAKTFFAAAAEAGLIPKNPFATLKGGQHANADRKFFVDRPTTAKLLDAAPNAEWRLIIALSRYGGLRCPSEHQAIQWDDVLWDQGKFWVVSPKTEGHEGKEGRWVPIFPELRPHLEEAFDLAPVGAVFVVAKSRTPGVNWRTRMIKILKRAGLTPWPRLFHNLRASRETELAAEWPLHVAAEWIGHSTLVAAKHYLMVRDEDFARAAGGAESGARAAQKAAQQEAARGTHRAAGTQKALENQGQVLSGAGPCGMERLDRVPPAGVESPATSSGKPALRVVGGAESGAVDPGLAEIASLWHRLTAPIRRTLLSLARAAAPPQPPTTNTTPTRKAA